MRWSSCVRRSMLALVLSGSGCSGLFNDKPLDLTLRITLAGGRNVGPTVAKIYVFNELDPVPRYAAFPQGTPFCALDTTPETTCSFVLNSGRSITLIAVESDPAIRVRFDPAAPEDTVRNGSFVEFVSWSACGELIDRGTCVLSPGTTTVDATFQLMTQVSVYQTGVAHMDWVTRGTDELVLKIPPASENILDLSGCRVRLIIPPTGSPCDDLRFLRDEPWHRITAFLPRGTVFGVFPAGGPATNFLGWDGPCTLSPVFGPGVCYFVAPELASVDAVVLTGHYEWWECPGGPRELDIGGCTLQPAQPAAGRRQQSGFDFR